MNQNPIFILAKLFRDELGLLPEQVLTTTITNDYLKSNVSNLFITIKMGNTVTLASEQHSYVETDILKEQKTIWKQTQYTIDIMSKNTEAFNAVDKIQLALISTKKKMLCNQYQIKIHDHFMGNINDISAAEGGSILKRFQGQINVAHTYDMQSIIDYYDTFLSPTFVHER